VQPGSGSSKAVDDQQGTQSSAQSGAMTEPQHMRLGRYRIVDEIGVGGMASVHLARMDGPGGFQKWSAIKRIHTHLIEDESFIQMFLDEARVAARISHPNVATVFELGQGQDSYWIAMEYLHGEPLREIMRRAEEINQPMPPEIACKIIADAAEGLHAAHELSGRNGEKLGLVHRDVTPHNLFVTYDGVIKVVDFGIAKFSSRMAEGTRVGTLKGKLAYMSPEQVHGEQIDRRTDIFALGVVLWELTTGQRLFRTDNDLDTLAKVQECNVPRPSTIVRGYPMDLEKVVLKALVKNRGERYRTAREFSRALQSFFLRRGLFIANDEVSSFMHAIFQERMAKRDAHLRWAAETTETVDLDDLRSGNSSPRPVGTGSNSRPVATGEGINAPPRVLPAAGAPAVPPRAAPMTGDGARIKPPPPAALQPGERASQAGIRLPPPRAGGEPPRASPPRTGAPQVQSSRTGGLDPSSRAAPASAGSYSSSAVSGARPVSPLAGPGAAPGVERGASGAARPIPAKVTPGGVSGGAIAASPPQPYGVGQPKFSPTTTAVTSVADAAIHDSRVGLPSPQNLSGGVGHRPVYINNAIEAASYVVSAATPSGHPADVEGPTMQAKLEQPTLSLSNNPLLNNPLLGALPPPDDDDDANTIIEAPRGPDGPPGALPQLAFPNSSMRPPPAQATNQSPAVAAGSAQARGAQVGLLGHATVPLNAANNAAFAQFAGQAPINLGVAGSGQPTSVPPGGFDVGIGAELAHAGAQVLPLIDASAPIEFGGPMAAGGPRAGFGNQGSDVNSHAGFGPPAYNQPAYPPQNPMGPSAMGAGQGRSANGGFASTALGFPAAGPQPPHFGAANAQPGQGYAPGGVTARDQPPGTPYGGSLQQPAHAVAADVPRGAPTHVKLTPYVAQDATGTSLSIQRKRSRNLVYVAAAAALVFVSGVLVIVYLLWPKTPVPGQRGTASSSTSTSLQASAAGSAPNASASVDLKSGSGEVPVSPDRSGETAATAVATATTPDTLAPGPSGDPAGSATANGGSTNIAVNVPTAKSTANPATANTPAGANSAAGGVAMSAPAKGTIRIVCVPSCSNVSVDGVALGPSPATAPASVGRHSIRATGGEPATTKTEQVVVEAGKTVERRVFLNR
jgi:eukaryotic-like serine/threonine-protein kinase